MVDSYVKKLRAFLWNPGFWTILVITLFITFLHYNPQSPPEFFANLLNNLGLTRHAFERILFLLPVFIAGIFFSWKGAFVTSLFTLALMIPRTSFLSMYRMDAIFETGAVFLISLMVTAIFRILDKERIQRIRLEKTQKELEESEQKYRQLFDGAHDAILMHDPGGKIVASNKNLRLITGYDIDELKNMKVTDLLSDDTRIVIEAIEQFLTSGEDTEWDTEIKILNKNKSQSIVHLSIRILRENGKSSDFLWSAQDVSQQKKMQENLQYYLLQATRAQEEERKRIALELHDEAIQDLVVLSRQLDSLASKSKELSAENSLLLKDLREQTKNIIGSLRNLSQDLRPAMLDRLGLLPALDYLATEITKLSDIPVIVNVHGEKHRLPEEVELVLFRITQEALRNVWKHSRASKAEINLEFSEQKVRISISDDGKGFSVPDRVDELSQDGKLGLIGMQERARLINGHLTIKSEPGKGTNINIEVFI